LPRPETLERTSGGLGPRDGPTVSASIPRRFQPEPGYLLARLGRENDGGYVVPLRAIMQSDYLLSFGLSLDWTFEEQFTALAPRKGVHCYDHTITRGHVLRLGGIAAMKAAIGSAPRKRLRSVERALSYIRFFSHRRVRHFPLAIEARDSTQSRSFETALDILSSGAGDAFLKCDIEGGEYAIADQISRRQGSLTGLAIEFHDIASDAARFHAVLDQLMSDFIIVHIHANNSVPLGRNGLADVLEVSFLNRSRAEADRGVVSVEGAGNGLRLSMDGRDLDAPNSTTAAEIELCYI
jgi:hypothetical protein